MTPDDFKKLGDEGGMITAFGVYHPLDPRVEEVRIADIAWSLSQIVRWNGASAGTLTVAEHSMKVSSHFGFRDENDLAFWGLLHDAAEAYLGDMIRPLRRHAEFGRSFERLEEKNLKVIAGAFDLPWPIPGRVWEADDAEMEEELRMILCQRAKVDHYSVQPYEEAFTTYLDFLEHYHMLIRHRNEIRAGVR